MRALFLLPLLVLAACETPQEACISDGTRQLGTIERLIVETRGNLARGYAIEEDQEVRVERDWCRVRLEDGSEGRVRCTDTDVVEVRRPVAIDLDAEQAKLDSLFERREALLAARQARIAQCVAAYPAE